MSKGAASFAVFGGAGAHPLGEPQRFENKWSDLAGHGANSAEMKQFAVQTAHEQIDVKLLAATLKMEKQLAGLVARYLGLGRALFSLAALLTFSYRLTVIAFTASAEISGGEAQQRNKPSKAGLRRTGR